MPDETIDALVLTARFDEQSLDASAQAQLGAVRRFASQAERLSELPPLNIDTTQLQASLAAASRNVEDFFASFTGAPVGDVVAALRSIDNELASVGQTGFLQELIPGLEAARAEFDATSTEAQELQGVIDALGGTPVAIDVGPALASVEQLEGQLDLFQQTATRTRETLAEPLNIAIGSDRIALLSGQLQQAQRAAVTLPPTLDRVAAGMSRAGNGSLAFEAGLRKLTQAHQAEAAAAITSANANQRLLAAFNQAGQSARAASAGSEAWARGLANIRGESAGLNTALVGATAGASRLRGGLSALAIQASGTSPAIGQVVSGLLLLGGGSAVVLGVAAGVAVIAAAFSAFTREAREAAEAQRALNEEFDKAIASRNPLPALTTAAKQFHQELVDIDAQLAKLRAPGGNIRFQADARSGIVTQTEVDNTARIADLEKQRAAALARSGEAGRQLSDFFAKTPEAERLAAAARAEADARKRAAESAAKQLEAMLQMQQALRIAAAGGGNLTQGAGGISQAPIEIPLILKPALDREALGTAMGDEIQAELEKQRRSAETLFNVLQGVNLALKDIGNADVKSPRTQLEQMAKAAEQLGQAVSAARSIRDTLRGIGTDAGDAVGNVLDLGEAVSKITDPRSSVFERLAGLVQGLKSVGNLLGFGKSQKELALEQAQRENTAALHLATRAYQASQGRFQGAGGIAEQREILQRVQANPAAAAAIEAGDITALSGALRGMGLTLDEVREIARTFGISLVKDHSLIEGGAAALAKAMEIASLAVTHFGTSIAERQQIEETRDRLGLGPRAGLPLEQQALERTREIELQGLALDPALEARIRGLDLATEEGRQAFLEFNQMLFDMAERGQLTDEQLNEFQSVSELRPIIDDAGLGINALADASRNAADAMIDIPRGFKQAVFAFQAQVEGLGPNAQRATTLTPTHFEPQVPGFSVTRAPGAAVTAPSTTISMGTVQIRIDAAGKDGAQLADEIVARLRVRSTANAGSTDQWSDL